MTTKETLQLRIETHYGTRHIYPVCKTGQLLAQLLGKKTMSKEDLAILGHLGYCWEVEIPTI